MREGDVKLLRTEPRRRDFPVENTVGLHLPHVKKA